MLLNDDVAVVVMHAALTAAPHFAAGSAFFAPRNLDNGIGTATLAGLARHHFHAALLVLRVPILLFIEINFEEGGHRRLTITHRILLGEYAGRHLVAN